MARAMAWAQSHRILLMAGMLVLAAATGSRDFIYGG